MTRLNHYFFYLLLTTSAACGTSSEATCTQFTHTASACTPLSAEDTAQAIAGCSEAASNTSCLAALVAANGCMAELNCGKILAKNSPCNEVYGRIASSCKHAPGTGTHLVGSYWAKDGNVISQHNDLAAKPPGPMTILKDFANRP